MTDREKLIKAITSFPGGLDGLNVSTVKLFKFVNHLIANGVTVQRWIPVTEGLPNEEKVIGGEKYFKNVAVRVKGVESEKIAYYDDELECWCDTDFFPIVGEVTHWMPLPEPPKEGME